MSVSVRSHSYFVHGRLIESTFPLSDLAASASMLAHEGRDVSLLIEKRTLRDLPTATRHQWLVRSPSGTSIAVRGSQFLIESYCGTRALIDTDSRRLTVARAPSISTTRFNHTIMHTLIPYALATQGDMILHAACVQFGGKTILLCGEGGRGKSTLAAGFQQRGALLLGEDIVRVEVRNNRLVAFPSYAGARLRSDSFLLEARRHGRSGSAFGLPKYRMNFSPDTTQIAEPSVVDQVFFLAAGNRTAAQFATVSGAGLMRELLANGFVATANSKAFRNEWFLALSSVLSSLDAAHLSYRKSPFHFQRLLEAIAARAGGELAPAVSQ